MNTTRPAFSLGAMVQQRAGFRVESACRGACVARADNVGVSGNLSDLRIGACLTTGPYKARDVLAHVAEHPRQVPNNLSELNCTFTFLPLIIHVQAPTPSCFDLVSTYTVGASHVPSAPTVAVTLGCWCCSLSKLL